MGFVTGGNKLVLRGGYARAYDASFANINTSIFQSFPFVATQTILPPHSFSTLINTTVPNISNPGQLSRTVVSEDFRAPADDQISIDVQRELSADLILTIGYVRTRGTGLFQTVDGNPQASVSLWNWPRDLQHNRNRQKYRSPSSLLNTDPGPQG